MEAPRQITPAGISDYFDVLTRAVFQPGMSWAVVAKKWPGTKEALAGFDPHVIADLTPPDIDQLMTGTRLLRNRKKLEATVHNAQTMLALDLQYGGFQNYLISHRPFENLSLDMRKRFKFLGEMGVYYFLYVAGEPVPPHEEWQASRNR